MLPRGWHLSWRRAQLPSESSGAALEVGMSTATSCPPEDGDQPSRGSRPHPMSAQHRGVSAARLKRPDGTTQGHVRRPYLYRYTAEKKPGDLGVFRMEVARGYATSVPVGCAKSVQAASQRRESSVNGPIPTARSTTSKLT